MGCRNAGLLKNRANYLIINALHAIVEGKHGRTRPSMLRCAKKGVTRAEVQAKASDTLNGVLRPAWPYGRGAWEGS